MVMYASVQVRYEELHPDRNISQTGTSNHSLQEPHFTPALGGKRKAPSWATNSITSPLGPRSPFGSRPPTTGEGCWIPRWLHRERPHTLAASAPPRGTTPPATPSQHPSCAPYLRGRDEAIPSPRSCGAACAEGRRRGHSLLSSGSPPHPRLHTAAEARREPHSTGLALTWGAAGARREGAAPWLPTGTELEGKGTGLDASPARGRPVLPPAPGSTLTRRQPGAQQRPDEELSLHPDTSNDLPRAAAALSTSRYRYPGLSPTGRGGRGFISRPRPALRPRPFPGHPARSPPLAPYRGLAERLRPLTSLFSFSFFSFLAFWV